jgi:Nucleotidyl transferase AbiEii toxin, Type IV TA system
MARVPDLRKAAVHLARLMGPDDCMLVGGMAVGAYGYVRATRDVDFVVRVSLEEVVARLAKQHISTTRTRGDTLEGDFPRVKGMLDGVPFDVMPPLVSLDWERVVEMPMGKGITLKVVSLEGLIRLKMRAQGPRDLLDVAALVTQHPEQLGLAKELATAYRVADKLDVWRRDPRLKAELEGPGPAKASRSRRRRARGKKA